MVLLLLLVSKWALIISSTESYLHVNMVLLTIKHLCYADITDCLRPVTGTAHQWPLAGIQCLALPLGLNHLNTIHKLCRNALYTDHKNNYLLFIDSYSCKQTIFIFLFLKCSGVGLQKGHEVEHAHPHYICNISWGWTVLLRNISVTFCTCLMAFFSSAK